MPVRNINDERIYSGFNKRFRSGKIVFRANCRANAIVADIVYRPLHTPLLIAARARGLTTIDGLGMLIHQGARSFELWFDVKPDAAKARARLLAALGETQ